jgi:hypothetical protein
MSIQVGIVGLGAMGVWHAGRAEPAVKPVETLRLMRVLDAVRHSARTGRVVRIKDQFAPRATARVRAGHE